MTPKTIISQAARTNKLKRNIDGCKLLKSTDTIETLIDKLLTPEGLAFARQTNFPSIDIFRAHKKECETKGIFIDKNMGANNCPFIFLIGKSNSKLVFDNQSQPYFVYLMHGAKADITATNGAVVSLFNISGEASISQNNYGKVIAM
jgi:hypothetical protein